jgi:hypothetical protein
MMNCDIRSQIRRKGAALRRNTAHRSGAMLVAALTVIVVIAAMLLALLVGVQHRAVAAQRSVWNAQADFAALAIATAPARPDSLLLPDGFVVQIDPDRVTLLNSRGRPISAALISSTAAETPAVSSEDLQ